MNTLAEIAAYHKNKQRTYPKYYFVCIDCGKDFDAPSEFKSCDSCNGLWYKKQIHTICQKCKQPKEHNRYGLCTKCFIQASKRNDNLTAEYARNL